LPTNVLLFKNNEEETMKALVRAFFATAALSFAAAGVPATAANMDQNQEPKAGEQGPPGTVGAMQNEVGSKATSSEDVKRQSEGKPTMSQSAKKGDSNATHPGMTNNPPGTVGAAPGANPETTRR
jgi:hypothetical protein